MIELEEDKAERIPDLLNLMERRGILTDANRWREMRAVRNLIAHEYGEDPERLGRLLDQVFPFRQNCSRSRRRPSTTQTS